MYSKFKKNTIFQSYKDFYNEEDLKDPETREIINLTIENFNKRGEIDNPRAPCVVTTIDREYTKDITLQRKTRTFRMKTDILTLREITRKKFMIHATQQRYLERQREAAHQEQIYRYITELQKFAAGALLKSEAAAFNEMKGAQQKLENLEKIKISDKLKKGVAEHQRVMMEVQEIYGRFLFLLKLIGYFDKIIAPEDIDNEADECQLPQLTEVGYLQISKRNPIGEKEILSITSYMNKTVRPYLEKRNHLSADIWIKEKTFARSLNTQNFLKDPRFLKTRISFLKQRSVEELQKVASHQKEDIAQLKLNAILPVILENVKNKLLRNNGNDVNRNSVDKAIKSQKITSSKESSPPKTNIFYNRTYNSSIEYVERLQWYLMRILEDLEKCPPDQQIKIEKRVRKRDETNKEMSKRILVKQNRLDKWMDHFKKHALLQQ